MVRPSDARTPVDVRRKALQLISLATSTTWPEEARTTALIAVRLIVEHNLLELSTPGNLEELLAKARAEGAREEQSRRFKQDAADRERAARAREQKPRMPRAPDGCAWIHARFDSVCIFCGTRVTTGEKVLWEKGAGVIHEACWPEAYAQAKAREQ